MKATDLAAIALVVLLIWNPAIPSLEKTPPAPVVSAELRSLLAPVKTMLADHPQRHEFAAWSAASADTIERDAGQTITTPATLAKYNTVAAGLRFAGRFLAVAGLADVVNKSMLQWVGKEADPLTADRTKRAIEFYRGLCWAGT